jgi:methylmalonyl-CoA mutase N-terminal domain/subunit
MDEALALPTEEAAKLALRTQQILAHEAGLRDAADPLGGAWYVEEETDRLEAEARRLLQEIDSRGGAVEALDYERREIERSALEDQRRVERGERIVVGVNRYAEPEPPRAVRTLKVDPRVEEERAREVARLKAARDGAAAARALDALRRAAEREENLVPAVLEAVRARATLGEICRALEERYGRHRPREGAA